MESWLPIVASVITTLIASSGFWTFILAKSNKNTTRDKLMMGLAHDRIIFLGSEYLTRGSITADEYENLHDYLYLPYKELGGNGTAAKVMNDVAKLRFNTTE